MHKINSLDVVIMNPSDPKPILLVGQSPQTFKKSHIIPNMNITNVQATIHLRHTNNFSCNPGLRPLLLIQEPNKIITHLINHINNTHGKDKDLSPIRMHAMYNRLYSISHKKLSITPMSNPSNDSTRDLNN